MVLRHEGYRDVRYPVFVARNREWKGHVRLRREDEIGEGLVYVPGGPCIQGGDRDRRVVCLDRSEPHVDDFYLSAE